jgi:translation initiation factor IF-3
MKFLRSPLLGRTISYLSKHVRAPSSPTIVLQGNVVRNIYIAHERRCSDIRAFSGVECSFISRFASRSFATFSHNKPEKQDGKNGQQNRPEKLSDVIMNITTGEKMPYSEYRKMYDKIILRVSVDGSKEEMTLAQAVSEAEDLDLDAVIVSMGTTPPVVKLMDHGKVRHDRKKKQKESVKKSQSTSTKELRLGLRIGQHDLDTKLKQAHEFIQKGHRVKLYIQLRGADFYNNQQQALDKVEEIAELLSGVATRQGAVTLLGRTASVTMTPGAPKKPAAEAGPKSAAPKPVPAAASAGAPAPAAPGAAPSGAALGGSAASPAPAAPAPARPGSSQQGQTMRQRG